MVTIKRFLINILMLRCGTMVFLLYLYLVIGLCGCNSKDGVPENLLPELLSITLSGKEELSIHPFLTADGGSYAVVLPAHWNIDELVAKYTSNDSFQVGETRCEAIGHHFISNYRNHMK